MEQEIGLIGRCVKMLLIDSREDSQLAKQIIKLCDKNNEPYEKIWLEIGDYVIQSTPSLCIEAKSTADFLQSIRNKRLFNQLDNMDKEYDMNVLLIYGSLDDAISYLDKSGKYGGLQWRNKLKQMLVGAVASITIHTDTKVIWVDTYRTASHIVLSCLSHIDKKLILEKQLPKKIRTEDVRIDLLTQIKGISNKKAKNLLKKFGSIAEISLATDAELCEIAGIGKNTAINIFKALNNERKVKY